MFEKESCEPVCSLGAMHFCEDRARNEYKRRKGKGIHVYGVDDELFARQHFQEQESERGNDELGRSDPIAHRTQKLEVKNRQTSH